MLVVKSFQLLVAGICKDIRLCTGNSPMCIYLHYSTLFNEEMNNKKGHDVILQTMTMLARCIPHGGRKLRPASVPAQTSC